MPKLKKWPPIFSKSTTGNILKPNSDQSDFTSVVTRAIKKGRVDSSWLDSSQKNFILYCEPTRVVYS